MTADCNQSRGPVDEVMAGLPPDADMDRVVSAVREWLLSRVRISADKKAGVVKIYLADGEEG